jgi:Fic family protein
MKSYTPDALPIICINYEAITKILGEANRALARYDGLLHGIPNPAILLSPLTTQEAVLSSKIEGTQVTLGEFLEYEAGGNLGAQAKIDDAQEIKNYRDAMTLARESLQHRSISLSFLKEMHAVLMDSVRGQDKTPGEFRVNQNWIGARKCPIEEATFVPPDPLQLVGHLEAWETYVSEPDMDPLVQVAVIHAQFELIHPFNDGNGRIGRLLIPLYLYSQKVLVEPTFYLSGHLEANRDEYIERLAAISRDGDWQGWIEFFLNAVASQAEKNSLQVRQVQALHEQMLGVVQKITHSQYSAAMVEGMFTFPAFNAPFIQEHTGIPKQTLHLILRQLKEAGIILVLQEGKGRRPAIHAFPELINITEGKEVFAKSN